MENPAILLRRLNPFCARAMEGAASLCQTRAHAEILPEHWLLKLLENGEGDLTVLARRYEWDMDALWQELLGWLDAQPRSVRSRPQLSDSVQTLMQEAWLRASLAGEESIRSIHLLMALVDKPKLVRCDGLWPLLTLAQSQLERLRPLLDAQSDERPEVQQEAELSQGHGGEVEFVGRPVNAPVQDGELDEGENVPTHDDIINMTGLGVPIYPIGKYPPNPLGLYDMGLSGSEWVYDWYDKDYYHYSEEKNSSGPSAGIKKVSRGNVGGDTQYALTMFRQANLPVPVLKGWVYERNGIPPAYVFRCVVNN